MQDLYTVACNEFDGSVCKDNSKGKGKAVPLQAWSGPEGSRKLRFPDFMTTAKDGGKVKVKQSRYRPAVAQRVPGS
jgi:hypothetical protein